MPIPRRLARVLAPLACLLATPTPVPATPVAITVDDLPIFATRFPAMPAARAITDGLLAGFRRHGWPVTGFVIEGELAGPQRAARTALLRAWLAAGERLGNHSYSHYSLAVVDPGTYVRDIARGDRVTRPLMARAGYAERWFRYPYLATGATRPARARVEAWLAAHGYRVAPVSLENSDWEFAEPYDAAIARHDPARAAAIRAAYLAYTRAIVAWDRRAAVALLGREPAWVLLLHANRLNAASIDALAAILDANGLVPTTLEAATRDPAYAIPDAYVGADGIDSIWRWSIALHRGIDAGPVPQVPADVAADYARIEAADPDTRAPAARK